MALVPKLPLPAQGAYGAGAADHQVGRRCFKRPSSTFGALHGLRQQGRRSSASERKIQRHSAGIPCARGGLVARKGKPSAATGQFQWGPYRKTSKAFACASMKARAKPLVLPRSSPRLRRYCTLEDQPLGVAPAGGALGC